MTTSHAPDGPRRVLVADDEHLVAAGLETSLAALGYDVVGPVTDGDAAIALAHNDGADIALLDIRMPGRDGIEIAHALWNDLKLPCIIVSAFSDDDYVHRAQETGIFGFILKPVTTDSLRIAIAIAWARAGSTFELQSQVSQLEDNLANRRIIERAKWKLVEAEGMSEAEAHSYLQRASRNARRSIADLARELIEEPATVTE